MSTKKNEKEDAKKKNEKEKLKRALEKGVKSEQEDTRRICLSLSESTIIPMEVPDFLLVNENEKIYYAVEHFRVDHQIKDQHGKIGAASAKFPKDNEKIRLKYKDNIDDNYLNAATDIYASVEGQLNRTFNATHEDLLKSFSYSMEGHSSKIGKYKENCSKNMPTDYTCKMVLLIEVVTDFSRLFKCSYRSVKRNFGGLMPFFDDVIDLLSKAEYRNVDYYVLHLTSYLGTMTQTIGIDNSCVKESLKRNGIKPVHDCTYEKYFAYLDEKAMKLTIGEIIDRGDRIDSHYKIDYRLSNNELYVPAVQTAAREALRCRERQKDYTVDYCTLFFMEVYGPNIKNWIKIKDTGLYVADIHVWDERTIKRRIKKFDEQYPRDRIY